MIVLIGEPDIPMLTPNQQRIKELLDSGHSVWKIAVSLHMALEYVREQIYEIRKREAIMGKGKLDNTQRAAIFQAWKNGTSQTELAKQYGVSVVAISMLIKKLNLAEEGLKNAEPLKKTQVNKEFDAAVDEMIAESKSANAENYSVNAEIGHSEPDLPIEKDSLETNSDTSSPEQLLDDLEDCENGIPNTPLVQVQDKLPPVVRRAVIGHLNDLEMEIEAREQRIDELQMEIEEFRKDIAALSAWKEAHT